MNRSQKAALVLAALPSVALALDELNWAPRNHALLEKLIREHGRGSASWDETKRPYAVFDWDQTSAFLDCGEATLRYQLWNLELRMSKEEFRALLKDEINGVRALSTRNISLKDLNADLLADYEWLLEHKGDPDVRSSPRFQDFIAKMYFTYEAYSDTPGIGTDYSYIWILYFFQNMTPEEVRSLAHAAIREQLAAAIADVTWAGANVPGSLVGATPVTWKSGLRVQPEMQDLMTSLRAAGIDVYVVTASLKQIVESFAAPGAFGYGVPADHVLGMEVEVEGGKMRPRYKKAWVPTVGQGKVDAIRQVLGSRGDPVLACGDSDGDAEMLSAFAGTKLSVILNRVRGGKIGALSRKAAEQLAEASPRFVLQGRDESVGLFVPRAETRTYGAREHRLLKDGVK